MINYSTIDTDTSQHTATFIWIQSINIMNQFHTDTRLCRYLQITICIFNCLFHNIALMEVIFVLIHDRREVIRCGRSVITREFL